MAQAPVDSVVENREFFQSLSDSKTPKAALGVSVGLHVALLVFVILVPLVAPQTLRVTYRTVLLEPPPEPSRFKPIELKMPPRISAPVATRQPNATTERVPIAEPTPVARRPEVRITEATPPPAVPPPAALPSAIPRVLADAKPAPTAAPQPPVITNVFSSTTPIAATGPARAKAEVTPSDGFADAGGSRERGFSSRIATIGALGGFDVTGVPGGTRGGSGGARGTVMTSGFVTASDAAKTPAASSKKAPEPISEEKALEILQKPRPDYTEEARKMKIEGEVLLRVLFTSSGELRVLEVVRGLGYGLNENAIRAAKQVRFKPAERGGQPVDSTAIVHIVFQLAY